MSTLHSKRENMRRNAALLALRAICVNVLMLQLFHAPANAQEFRPTREYQIKASLIFNFLQFIEWPPEVWDQENPSVRICVTGQDRFGIALSVLEREIVNGRHIVIVRVPEPDEEKLRPCHVVFIGNESDQFQSKVLALLGDRSVLSIGESRTFLEKGGAINVLVSDSKMVFDINREAAFRARLNISSKLLRIARNVIG